MKSRRIVWLVLLPAFPAALVAQDARLERVRQAYPAETVAQIESILVDAQAAGVPRGPLVDKALEGAAKGVPGDRVVAALSAYSGRLGQSRSLMGADRDAASVVAGADALRRGVPPQTVRTMARQHQGDIAVPLVVMGDLVQAGVPADHAYQVVEGALARQHDPEEMLAIPGAVHRLMRQGQSPTQAADMIGNAIGQGHFREIMGRHGGTMAMPRKGAPVPPGSGPPEHGKMGEKGKHKGKPPGGGM